MIDQAGSGISEAEVSLAYVTAALREERRAWRSGGWGGAEFDEVRTTTDAHGRFALQVDEANSGWLELVVWASLPGQRAAYQRVVPSDVSTPLELVLDPASAVAVHVLQADGSPVVGAHVQQRGEWIPAETSDDVYVAPILFRRDATADGDAHARIAAFPGLQVVRAIAGGSVSTPVRVYSDETEVTLRLGESFEVHGTAVLAPAAEPPPEPERTRLSVRARVGAAWRELAVGETDAQGAFGAIQVPLVETEQYELRAEGIWLRPQRIAFPPPSSGDSLRFDLELERGLMQWLLVQDEEGNPIIDARGELLWLEDGEVQSLRGLSRGDGYIPFVAAAAGNVIGVASAPGYAPGRSERFAIPTDPPETIKVMLPKAAEVTGRVIDILGQPVSSFQVIWYESKWHDRFTWDFHGREDGRFRIPDAPRGSAFWYAAAPEGPGSESVYLDLGPNGADVELKLKPPQPGRGRVVDAATGDPLPGARVLSYVMIPNGALVRFGAPVPVSADGSFMVRSCVAGLNEITVEAEGYGSAFASATAEAGGVDFGTIELGKRRGIVVELEDPTAEGYQLDLFGPDAVGGLVFPPSVDGVSRLVVPGLSQGRFQLSLRRPEGGTDEATFDLREGTPGFRLIGSAGCTLDVRLAGAEGLPDEGGIWVRYDVRGLGQVVRQARMPLDGRRLIPGLPDGVARILVFNNGETVGRATATCVRGRVVPVVVQVATEGLALTILDADDEPLVGATALITPEAGPPVVMVGRSTDEGQVSCEAIQPGRYYVTFHHGEAGLMLDVPIDVAPGPDPTPAVIRLVGDAALRLLVVDGGEPVAGVRLTLLDRFGDSRGDPMLTAADGLATHARLHAGPYRVRIDGDGVWPEVRELVATKDPVRQDVEVRRRGDLRLEVRAPSGVPVSGATVALTSLTDGVTVDGWIEQGLIHAPDGVETDSRGRLQLDGLPRGDYRWELGSASGLVRVVGDRLTKAVIVVGE